MEAWVVGEEEEALAMLFLSPSGKKHKCCFQRAN